MFLNNKYTKWYDNIILNSKNQFRKKSKKEYFEKHHIIPKSFGGSNLEENLVLLTPREHFICHLLLVKMCILKSHTVKMIYALDYMTRKTRTCKGFDSKYYDYIKKLNSKTRSENMRGINNPFYGKTHSDEYKKKFSEQNPAKREEVRNKMRKPKIRIAPYPKCSIEKAAKISSTLLGKKYIRSSF